MKSEQTAGENYQQGISEEKYVKGVQAVKTAPGQKAAQNKQKMLDKTVAGKQKLLNSLGKATIGEWQSGMNDSLSKLQQKANRAADTGKYPSQKILDAAKSARSAVAGMPNNNYNEAYAKMKKSNETIASAWGVK